MLHLTLSGSGTFPSLTLQSLFHEENHESSVFSSIHLYLHNHYFPIKIDNSTPSTSVIASQDQHNSEGNAGTCSFTVIIRTSCYSTRFTRDRISIAFGDAYGNQVYAPRLDDPYSMTFEACSSDTFTLYGPCTYQICYLYLYRSGYDGWIPYDVTIYGYNTRAVTFYYNVRMPSDIWYGFNYCYGTRAINSLAVK